MRHNLALCSRLACLTAASGLILLAAGCAENLPEAFKNRKPEQATLKVFRDHTSHGVYAASLLRVYVNDIEIGSLKDGQTKELNFEPREGENTLKVALDLGDGSLRKEHSFTADPGSLTSVKTCCGWLGWDLSAGKTHSIAQEFRREITDNTRMLIPTWYKSAYFIRFDDDSGGRHFNRLHVNLLLLGLILYPLLWCAVAWLGNLAEASGDERITANLVAGLVLAGVSYVAVLLLGLLIAGGSYLVCGLLSDKGHYIPWDFASFSLHILILLFLVLWLASLLVPRTWRIPLPVASRRPHSGGRFRLNYGAMIKAFLIMILSALASQLAGWIAGLIVLAVGAGFGMATSDGSSTSAPGHGSP